MLKISHFQKPAYLLDDQEFLTFSFSNALFFNEFFLGQAPKGHDGPPPFAR